MLSMEAASANDALRAGDLEVRPDDGMVVNEHDRMWRLEELGTFGTDLQQAIVINIFKQQAFDEVVHPWERQRYLERG